jgi:hypothetical protein
MGWGVPLSFAILVWNDVYLKPLLVEWRESKLLGIEIDESIQ